MRRLFFVIALVVASFGRATAQDTTTGTIEGTVADSQGLPVPGATVSIIDSSEFTKTFFTDGAGRFFVPFLTPDTYSVVIEMSGFQPIQQDDVLVVLGRRTALTMTIEPGGLTEVVRVTGTVKAVDLSSTTAGAVIGDDDLARLPVGRRMTDTLLIAPGVTGGGRVGGGSGDANANPSIAGGSGLENNYIVDGVNITNAGYGGIGSYSIVFGSLGSGVTFDFIKEIQIKTAGYEAEYGQAAGGVVNVITKSGSNVLRGSAFGYFRPSALEGGWTPTITTNATRVETVNTTETRVNDIGFEVGDAAIRNKLFFFGAANPQWETKSFIAPEGFALRNLGAFDRERRVTTYAAKATYQLTSTPHRRLVLRRSGARQQRSAAARIASSRGHLSILRDQLRRPQPGGQVRRHHEQQLAARGLVRTRLQQDPGIAGGRHVEHHRPDGDAEHPDRRSRVL